MFKGVWGVFASDDVAWSEPSMLSGLAGRDKFRADYLNRLFVL